MAQTDEWHVDKLEVRNFRAFDSLTIDLHPELTVLVGVNGTGKTAVLDAIAIMLSTVLREFGGDTRGFLLSDAREVAHDLLSRNGVARMERTFPVVARVEGTVAGSRVWWVRERSRPTGRTTWADRNTEVGQVSREVWNASEDGDPSAGPLLPVIAQYGVERLQGVKPGRGSIARSRAGAYDSALEGKSDFKRLSAYLRALTLADLTSERKGEVAEGARQQILAIQMAADRLLERTGWHSPEWDPVVEEIVLHHPERGVLPLAAQSSGIKIAAGLVIDLVSRMARANPRLGADELLRRVPGIVLIDEIDLHLHPNWQQSIIPTLRSTFPRVQFIVTTHSPQVLSTVEAPHIKIIDGETVHGVDYSAGLRTDIVMKKVLGTQPEPALPINQRLDEYMRFVEEGKGRTQPARRLRQELDEELGGVTNVPKLADADATIAFYELDL